MSHKQIKIEQLMAESNVKFGTSGARGLVQDMTDEVCYAYTLGFLSHLEQLGEIGKTTQVGIGGDLRPSTERIMTAVAKAVTKCGLDCIGLGRVPSPAVCLYGIAHQLPTVMVTGSHIPADRNGIKYTKKAGEILKADEAAIRQQVVTLEAGLFDSEGNFADQLAPLESDQRAADLYVRRYLDFFPTDLLSGKRIGVYQHSAVGRDLLLQIYEQLGATVVALGYSDQFVPVDTEAIRTQDIEAARRWSEEHHLDAIVSTDGDSDRPLISDEHGKWLRGDLAGILCAAWLEADCVVTPVSCNSAVEKSDRFAKVVRTRIGSPYVIEAMQQARAEGYQRVVGYEANGGFLIESNFEREGRRLRALPTRDAVILQLAILSLSVQQHKTIRQLTDDLPQRFTFSDRLKEFPIDKSKAKIAELYSGDFEQDKQRIEAVFGSVASAVSAIDATDGVRITFGDQRVVHLRPSGNAPEFRCYTEAESEEQAVLLNQRCIAIMENWRV